MNGPLAWGRLPHAPQRLQTLLSRDEIPDFSAAASVLARGLGRSYGDSALNDGGLLFDTRRLDRYIAFDEQAGVIECEAGVSLGEIQALVVPRGWFLPVMPGTQFVTVGGAIANDVHGKNHHRAGSFGHHVLGFELLRSDGRVLDCTPQLNTELFAATVGGLGLTGLIRRARLVLRRVEGPLMRVRRQRFARLQDYFALAAEADARHEYTVAWIDCASSGSALGRGVLDMGDHAATRRALPPPRPLSVPLTPPLSLVNRMSLRAFNALYWLRARDSVHDTLGHWQRFFHPLDAIAHWNRLYGPRGFYQYQCVVPPGQARDAVGELLARIAASGQGSMLAVLKSFGTRTSPGLMSFPRPGVTLALDFPNLGERTLRLLKRLDDVTREAGGAVYPAKDARMSAEDFQAYFPRWREFSTWVDPRFSSSFWRRVTGVSA